VIDFKGIFDIIFLIGFLLMIKLQVMYYNIQGFFNARTVAVVGASRKDYSHSQQAMKVMVEKGQTVFPVNPSEETIAGVKSFKSISDLPNEVEAAFIILRKERVIALAREAAAKGVKFIWIHEKCTPQEIDSITREYDVKIISGECFFMWAEPVKGVHKFHRFLRGIFDRNMPKSA